MKRTLLIGGILAMLLFASYQPAAAEPAPKPIPTCGATCEDRAEQAVISCLRNGGD